MIYDFDHDLTVNLHYEIVVVGKRCAFYSLVWFIKHTEAPCNITNVWRADTQRQQQVWYQAWRFGIFYVTFYNIMFIIIIVIKYWLSASATEAIISRACGTRVSVRFYLHERTKSVYASACT